MSRSRNTIWSLQRMLVACALAGVTTAMAAGCGTPLAEPSQVPQGPPPPEQPRVLGEFVSEDSLEAAEAETPSTIAAPADEQAQERGAGAGTAEEEGEAAGDESSGDDSDDAEDESGAEPEREP